MTMQQLEPVYNLRAKINRLQAEYKQARLDLTAAEAELAQEQAAVNAFRMHCRLKLDNLIDILLALRADKQALFTRLQLLQQAQDLGIRFDEDDPFWNLDEDIDSDSLADDADDLLLPTDTPHDKAAEKRLYRELARRFHPDLAETAVEQAYRTSIMSAINSAYQVNDIQALYDLAGELEPGEIAELAGIEVPEVRRLRELILKCHRLRRKAQLQLRTLRRENTARMWLRAQQLDETDADYWSVIKRELEAVITKRELEVVILREQVAVLEAQNEHVDSTIDS